MNFCGKNLCLPKTIGQDNTMMITKLTAKQHSPYSWTKQVVCLDQLTNQEAEIDMTRDQ